MTAQTAWDWLLEQPTPERCGPSHLCDGWSECIRGAVCVDTPAGVYVTRLHECLRPHESRAVVLVSMTGDPDRPMFTSRFVPAEMVRPISDEDAAMRAVVEEARNVLQAHDDADGEIDWTGPMVDFRLRKALSRLDDVV